MNFPEKTITLKNGTHCVLRSPSVADADSLLAYLKQTSGETDYMLRYPEEITLTTEQEEEFLKTILESEKMIMIAAFIEGKLVGNCSISQVDDKIKIAHRAGFGIALLQKVCGLGLGSAMLREIIASAETMGFEQIELEVDESNQEGIGLYKKMGFVPYGLREHAFKRKDGTYSNEILMMKKLTA